MKRRDERQVILTLAALGLTVVLVNYIIKKKTERVLAAVGGDPKNA